MRGATLSDQQVYEIKYISIHAPREGSDLKVCFVHGIISDISIHAPREGSDVVSSVVVLIVTPISIHAPREGSDAVVAIPPVAHQRAFQSTLPVRGAT